MKTVTSFLFLVMIFCSVKVNAQKITVNCNIELNGSNQPDSIFIGLFPTRENSYETGVQLPDPVIFKHVSNRKLSFEADPGIYMIGCCAWKYGHAYRLIYLDPKDKTVNIKFRMYPLPIGWGIKIDKIETVVLVGEYNNFRNDNGIKLEEQKSVWKLTNIPAELKIGQKYRFTVNGEDTEDLFNNNILVNRNWLIFFNIYTGNEIKFDPSVYGKQENYSQVEIENTSVLNEQLMPLASDMYTFKKQQNGVNYNTSPANRKAKVDSLFMNLALIEKKYDPGFRQLFVEKKLEINQLKLISIFPDIPSQTPEQLNEFFSGKNFLDFFEENLKLLQELNPKSYLLEGNFLLNLYLMKTLIKEHPDVLTKYNLHQNYFDDFAENFIDNSPNERLCCNMLFYLANLQIYENEDKAKVSLDKLKQYPYEKYVSKESVSQLYATLNLKIGKYAPDFTIKTLAGSNINLSAFKGKFVFLDFWGSWCAPCLRETPYIKKLYSSVSREKLEIIGLAQDKEEPLRKYITENGIEYPNALASPSLLSEYGIRSYPTSFLINPDGKIVRMNMRGEAELNLIAEEIERYFK